MRKLHSIGILLTLGVLVAFYGCSARYVPTFEYGDMNAPSRVLIATTGTDFKDAVIEKVSQELAEDGVYVMVIDLKIIDDTETEKYDAILLVNAVTAWRIDYHVSAFLQESGADEKEKLIILTTAGDPDWEAQGMAVDAISSASTSDNISLVADQVVEKIRMHLVAR